MYITASKVTHNEIPKQSTCVDLSGFQFGLIVVCEKSNNNWQNNWAELVYEKEEKAPYYIFNYFNFQLSIKEKK